MHIHRHAPSATTAARPEIHHTTSTYLPPTATHIFHHPSATRDDGDTQLRLPRAELGRGNESGLGAFRILIPISVAAWVLFGASCILCINGKGRAGRWVPEWYLDSRGSRWDRAMVAAWWLAVMLLWPVILPVLLVGKLVRSVGKALAGNRRSRRKKLGDEESPMVEENAAKPGKAV